MRIAASSPFGGTTRTRVLIALRLLGSSYLRELSRLLDAPVSGVRQAILSLERDGLVAARSVGRTRLVELDPAYFARGELATYLARLADAEPELQERTRALRRRPRRTGKPL